MSFIYFGVDVRATDTGDILGNTATDLSVGSNFLVSILPLSATTTDLQLSGTYTGGTTLTINGAALGFGTLNDLNTTQNLILTNTNALAGSITLNTAANSTSGANASDLLYVAPGGNLTLQNGTGILTLNVATTGNIDNAGTLNIASPLNIAIGQTATFTGAGATTVSGNISALLGSVVINAAGGSVTLSGNNGYTGTTTITSGTLNAANIVVGGATSNLGNAASPITLGGASTKGILNYTGNTATYTRGFTVNAGGGEVDVATAGQTLTIGTGNISTGSGVLTIGGAGDTSITSVIGNGSGGLTKTGTGTLTLGSVESYTGATVVSGGTLALGHANAIATSTSLGVSGGGVLSLGSNNTTVNGGLTLTSGSITGSGSLTAGSSGTSYAVINGSVGAVLGGTGDKLVKATDGTGTGGTVILSGTNTYTGATSINAGTLEIDGSLAAGSSVNVGGTSGSAAPTLTGTGTVNGAVTISSANGGTAGTVNPGGVGTTGTLTVGSINFQNGGDLSLDVNGVNSDLLAITHAATIAAGAGIKIAGNALSLGDYVLATAASGLDSASFTVVGSLPTGYKLVSSSTELDLQHLANQSLTSTSAASISIILNSNTPVGALLSNIVPVGSTFLNVNLSDAGGTGGVVTGLTSSAGTTIAGGASSTIAGTLTATTAGLGETWGIKNVDLGAIATSVTASGTLNVYNHSSPTLTIATGNNQSAFVGGTLADATLVLSDTTGTFPAPLDVNTLVNLTGATGSGVVATGGTGTYTSTPLSTLTAGVGQTLGVSLRAGDQQTIIGAGPLSTLNQTITYNVYNHSAPTLTIGLGNNQSVFVNGSITGATVTLSNSGTAPVPLDVNTLTNLTGTTGLGVISSGGSGTYTATGFNTSTVGINKTLAVSLMAGDQQSIPGANPLNTLSQSIAYSVFNHATSNLLSGTLNLGNIHVGYTSPVTSSNSLTATNGAVSDLRVNLQGSAPAAGNVSLTSLSGIASGGSGSISATLATGQAVGLVNTPVTYTFADQSAITGASNDVGTAAITVGGEVYSGQSVWAGNGTASGSWGTLASGFGLNWGANQGSPGLDANFTSTDTATFGNVSGQASQLVTLDGANPSLNGITFDASSTAYTLAQGTGGTVTLDGGAGPATVTDMATGGTQTISAPINLATNININVAANRALTISGNISGTGGLTTMGPGTTIFSGTDVYTGPTTISSGTLAITGTTLSTGTVMVGNGTALAGTGSTGIVSVAGGGGINLRDGVIGTLTVNGLTLGNAGTPSLLSFDIGAGTTGNLDRIVDNGALAFNGVAGTTINIGPVSGAPVLTSGTYTLISSTGLTGNLTDVGLSQNALDGKSLSLNIAGDSLDLVVADLTTATTYSLSAAATDSRIMVGGSTTVMSTITNTGSADTVTYSGLNATTTAGTLSGGTLPQNGGPLAANGGTASGSVTLSGFTTTGAVTITPTVTSATNTNLGGNALLDSATPTTVDVVANRVVTATAVSFGRVIVGQAVSSESTLSTTGDDADFTRVTVGTTGADLNGISATGGTAETFNGASVTDTRVVGGTFASAGSVAGTLNMTTTGEGLAGESPINVALDYTADPVMKRIITNGAVVDLGLFHSGDTVSGTSSAFTTTGSHDTTTDVSVAAGSGVADVNDVTLTGAATVFNGTTSSGTRTFGGTITSATGGVVSGSFNLAATTLENSGLGLAGEGAYNPVNVAYTAFVYTGQGVWNFAGGGSWGTVMNSTNWTADGGTPGLDPSFTSSDTATFGNATGNASAVITLGGASPSLQAITFSNTVGGSFTIAPGSGGLLKMNGGVGGAMVDNANGSNKISAPMEFDSNASVFAAANSSLNLLGDISESGAPRSLAINGPGTVLINGANAYSGGTMISSGTVVAGTSTALGTGNVTMNGGTMETGNGMHQIDVAQNYTQTGGTLLLNLWGTTPGTGNGYEFLHVAGTAALGGALQVMVQPVFVPVNGDTFTFVQAGTITGGFSSETSNLRALSITPQGVGTITINQLPFNSMPCVQSDRNENSIATYIDNAFVNGTTSLPFQALIVALDDLTGTSMPCAALADAFDQLSTEKFHNFVRETVFNNTSFSTQMLDGYVASRRSSTGDFLPGNGAIDSSNLTINSPDVDSAFAQIRSQLLAWNPAALPHGLLSDSTPTLSAGSGPSTPTSATNPGRDFNLFVSGNVVLAQGYSQVDLSHFTTTTGGVQVGASYRVTPHVEVGTLFSYNHVDGDLDNIGSKATIDSYAPGVFVSFADHGWYANALGSYGFDSFTENRNISFGGLKGTSHGAPSGNQITGDFDGGYDFHVHQWTFGPEAGVQYTNLAVDHFTEEGYAPTDLRLDHAQTSSLRSRIGGHLSRTFQFEKALLTPHLDAFWQHEFLDQGQDINAQFTSVGASSFNVTTPRSSRDSVLIDVGLTADLNGQVSVFADDLLQAGQNNYLGDSVQVGVRIGF